MNDLKNKLYHFEAVPPEQIWKSITDELDNTPKAIPAFNRTRSRVLFYGLTAAASLVIIFIGSRFFNKNNKHQHEITVAENSKTAAPPALQNTPSKDSITLNQQILKSIINSPEEKKEILDDRAPANKKYLTIAGPEGQPVKISPKVATLIISANNDYPPKPVWSRKINKWQKIMLSSTISPTSTNIIDLVAKENIE